VYELLLEAAEQARRAGDDRGRAIDLARAVETACRFPEAFETAVPHERLRGLFDDAVAAAPADDPEVAACVAVARAWLAGPVKGAPDGELASAAVAATRMTADPVLISSGLCAEATAALHAGRLREANRITRERLRLLPSMDRDDPYCAPEICNTYGHACVYAIMVGDLPGGMAAARAGIEDDLLSDTHITASRLVQPLVLTGRFRDAIGNAERMWDQWERAGRPAPLWMLPAAYTTVLASALLDEPESVASWRSRAAEVAGGTLGTAAVAAFVDARLALHDGRYDDAAPLVRRAFAVNAPVRGGGRGTGRGGAPARRRGPAGGRHPARRGERLDGGLPRPCARTPPRRPCRAVPLHRSVGTPGRAGRTGPHGNATGALLASCTHPPCPSTPEAAARRRSGNPVRPWRRMSTATVLRRP
jgi:hypothetical protein